MSTWNINKIGGNPDWMHDNINTYCLNCGKSLLLICQLYCPLDQSPYHRTLYILACTEKICWNHPNGWLVLRCNKNAESSNKKIEFNIKSAFNEFYINNLDWGEDTIDYSNLNSEIKDTYIGIKDKMENLGLNALNLNFNVLHPIPDDNSNFSFKSYYINVFNNEDFLLQEYDDLWHENELLQKYLQVEGISIAHLENQDIQLNSDEGTDRLMRNKINKNFLKYKKAINECPSQVIRYSHRGEELFLNESLPTIPNCECGAARVFELQLMPSILNYLHFRDSFALKDPQFEFLNVMVYTCSGNCMPQLASNQQYKNEYIYLEIDDTSLHNFERKH